MNEKFYQLPGDRQKKIISAGFLVFSQNSYRKSPMLEIASHAGISKSLLFHYFHNKKELYLFLWDKACTITMKYLAGYGCYDSDDLFEMMERGMRAKIHMMKKYPRMTSFVVRAFYEREPEITAAVQEKYHEYFGIKAQAALARVNLDDFVEGLDLEMMYREMYLASEGYLWEVFQWDRELNVSKLESDFEDMLKFWKKIYLKKGEKE